MITNYIAAAFLITPLIAMVFPATEYWRFYQKEKKAGSQGNKARYNFSFYLLVAGVLGMWSTWIGGIIYLFSPHSTNIVNQANVGSIPVWLLQTAGLGIFLTGAVTYNLAIVAAGKYLRPAPSGTLDRHVLIDKGPFAVIRHPLYTAYFLINAGLGLTFLNLIPLGAAVLIALGIYPAARAEEAVLVKQLGNKYTCYQQRVGMFFPRLLKKQ